MSIALTLLADVSWRGRPVAGDRPQALLAALAVRDCRPVRPEDLIELVWGDDAPSNGPKSLQVLVSRVRNACGADAIYATSRKWLTGPRGVGLLGVTEPWWDRLTVRTPQLYRSGQPAGASPLRLLAIYNPGGAERALKDLPGYRMTPAGEIARLRREG